MKDSFWFQHDSNAQHDERVLELRAEYGWEGYGLFWGLVEKMRDCPDYRLSMATVGGLSAGMGVLKPLLLGIIDLACKYGLLATEENGAYFYSPSLRRRMGQWDNKKASLSEAGRVGAERKKALKEAAKLREVEATLKPPLSHPDTFASTVHKRREEKSTSNDVATAPEALKAKSKAEIVSAQVAADGGATYTADTFTALNDAQTFASLMDYLGHVGIDTERYRLDIRGKVKAAALDVPAASMGKYIVSYLTRELASGPLTPAPLAARPASVMPDDPCSLWGAPNPDYDHRAYSQTAGQYTGTIQ